MDQLAFDAGQKRMHGSNNAGRGFPRQGCSRCKKKQLMQRSALRSPQGYAPGAAQALPGRQIGPAARGFVEPSPGHDFSRMQVLPGGDIYEQEADRISRQVMLRPQGRRNLQMRQVGADGAGSGPLPQAVREVLSTPGRPLDPEARAFMEPRFGRDFSRIRVHADSRAEQSAHAVHARAYTVGRHIVFGSGEYTVRSHAGRSLLAHELAHTAQQGSAGPGVLQRQPRPGAEDMPCPLGEMRLGKGLPCVPFTMPGRDCPFGQVKFAGQCVPFRKRPSLLDTTLQLDPALLRPPGVTAPGTSGTGPAGTTTQPGTVATGKRAIPKDCKYSVNYAKPVEVDCDTVWRSEKGTAPPGPLCGKRAIFQIVSITASDSKCPLEGLAVSERVATVPDTHSCHPPNFVWPAPTPCITGPGGKLTGCTDTLTVCGPTSELHFGGCEENVKQDILLEGKVIENHTIVFELDVQGNKCTGTVTRN